MQLLTTDFTDDTDKGGIEIRVIRLLRGQKSLRISSLTRLPTDSAIFMIPFAARAAVVPSHSIGFARSNLDSEFFA
jgi:hypothetical protein